VQLGAASFTGKKEYITAVFLQSFLDQRQFCPLSCIIPTL